MLQERLNPNEQGRKAERRLMGTLFRVGDKVIQTRNNYEKDVFNGDIGQVYSFDMTDQVMTVMMDGRPVQYDWSEADELTHAYCISVHRAQGSEYPCVVMRSPQHYMMLSATCATAVAGRQFVVLVGTRKRSPSPCATTVAALDRARRASMTRRDSGRLLRLPERGDGPPLCVIMRPLGNGGFSMRHSQWL